MPRTPMSAFRLSAITPACPGEAGLSVAAYARDDGISSRLPGQIDSITAIICISDARPPA